MDFKIGKSEFSINIHELSKGFDRISNLNSTLTFLFFFINVVVAMHYTFMYNGLLDAGNTTDISIILVPVLGIITTFLLCSFHHYSTNIKNVSDLLGMMLTVFCINLLFAVIPVIGFKFDVLGISADYWSHTSNIITYVLVYLVIFGVANFIIKAEARNDIKHG
jgi:hypothetical protein